ncbi:MAG: hypothetical protein ACN2B6_11850 [Rickettsiales bacterium]
MDRDEWAFAVIIAAIVAGLIFSFAYGLRHDYRCEYDNAKREKILFQCMDRVPEGPQSTVYNDWDEVIKQCKYIAADMSKSCFTVDTWK